MFLIMGKAGFISSTVSPELRKIAYIMMGRPYQFTACPLRVWSGVQYRALGCNVQSGEQFRG